MPFEMMTVIPSGKGPGLGAPGPEEGSARRRRGSEEDRVEWDGEDGNAGFDAKIQTTGSRPRRTRPGNLPNFVLTRREIKGKKGRRNQR